jgi:diphthamide synthase (EF-2-diphthine--ammonia ligase)
MDILFWSGGKDSFLALQCYRKANPKQHLKLLTTYDENKEWIPQQNLSIKNVQKQVKILGLELVCVPLPPKCPNDIYVNKLDSILKNQREPVGNLLFGDWYLQDIRSWREKQFGERGYSCKFPIWQKKLSGLLEILSRKPVDVRISAVARKYKHYMQKGEVYDQHFVNRLPGQIDPMGEKGEFHTEVIFKH